MLRRAAIWEEFSFAHKPTHHVESYKVQKLLEWNMAPRYCGEDVKKVQMGETDHRSPKRPKTVLSGGRLREMTWWSQTNFFRDHLYHCYGFYLDRLDTPSSFSLISENQLIFRF